MLLTYTPQNEISFNHFRKTLNVSSRTDSRDFTMVHHLEHLPTPSLSQRGTLDATPPSEAARDNEYRSCPAPPRRGNSATDQGRFVISSKLPLSGSLSIPPLARPRSKALAKKTYHKGMSKVVEQQQIPSFKLKPKQSIDLRGCQLGAQLGF